MTKFSSENIQIELCIVENQLMDAISHLRKVSVFAFDLEFDKNNRYYGFQLFLLQIFCENICYIIDPLSIKSLTSLWDVFEDETICKVVFSGGEDIRLLQQLECYPKNLFDCQIAVQLLDYPKTSLASVLDEKFSITLDKRLQKSDWSIRPLSKAQLIYASNDVVHLLKLQKIYIAEMAVKKVSGFFSEENEILCQFKPVSAEIILEEREKQEYSPFHQYILLELKKLRDQYAKSYNRPPHYIFPENLLRSLVDDSNVKLLSKENNGIYGPLQRNKNGLKTMINEATQIFQKAETLNLSRSLPVKQRIDYESLNWIIKRENEITNTIFLPIQEYLSAVYGKNAIHYLCNSEVKKNLVKGIHLRLYKRVYQQELIIETAKILNIDIEVYLF
jgi:ribonuclease D